MLLRLLKMRLSHNTLRFLMAFLQAKLLCTVNHWDGRRSMLFIIFIFMGMIRMGIITQQFGSRLSHLHLLGQINIISSISKEIKEKMVCMLMILR